jgi:hypothetical protein
MCQEWLNDFSAFLDHIGYRPSSEHTLDRYPNKSGNYEPDNVRWATRIEQQRNLSTNLMITVLGETMCLAAAVEKYRRPYLVVFKRLQRGWTPEEALELPK